MFLVCTGYILVYSVLHIYMHVNVWELCNILFNILEYSEWCLHIAIQTKVEGCNCLILCNYCVI